MKNLLTNLFLFASFIFYSCKAFTQTNYYDIDSLKKILTVQKEDTNKANALDLLSGDYYHSGDYENTIRYAQELLTLSTRLNYIQGIVYGYADIAQAYAIRQDRFSELKYFDSALAYAKKKGNNQNIIDAYEYLSSGYELMGDFGNYLETELNAQKLREKTGNNELIADGYVRIASAYISLSNDSAGKRNVDAALELYKDLNNKKSMATCYSLIGAKYSQQGKFSEALNQYDTALLVLKDQNEPMMAANIYASIGTIYKYRGDSAYNKNNNTEAVKNYLAAEKNHLVSLKMWKGMFDRYPLAGSFIDLGFLNINIGNFKKARAYLDSSLEIYQSIGLKPGIGYVYYGFSKIDSAEGDYKKAYTNYKLFKIYYDSAAEEENDKKAVQVQMQDKFDKKEAVAKAAQDKKDADAKLKKYQQFFILLGVIIIAVIQYRNNKKKQKANLLLQGEKQKVENTLSELKSTQDQLIQSEKMASLGELTAGIAHEIQNPLNFVNNFSEVNKELLAEMKDEMNKGNIDDANDIANDVIANSEKINHHGKRADSIVKGMLQHSRSSTSVKESTDINALADEYLRLSYHGLRAKDNSFNATIKTEFDESIGLINIIPQDIGRVLLNLYNNAFYTTAEKKKQQTENYEPTVSVSTNKKSNQVTITVSDNGNGIPQKVVDKIFQPFFTTKPTGQGTGLGLSLSYDIITKEHNGTIKVKSKEGEGSEFIIQLPVV